MREHEGLPSYPLFFSFSFSSRFSFITLGLLRLRRRRRGLPFCPLFFSFSFASRFSFIALGLLRLRRRRRVAAPLGGDEARTLPEEPAAASALFHEPHRPALAAVGTAAKLQGDFPVLSHLCAARHEMGDPRLGVEGNRMIPLCPISEVVFRPDQGRRDAHLIRQVPEAVALAAGHRRVFGRSLAPFRLEMREHEGLPFCPLFLSFS